MLLKRIQSTHNGNGYTYSMHFVQGIIERMSMWMASRDNCGAEEASGFPWEKEKMEKRLLNRRKINLNIEPKHSNELQWSALVHCLQHF